MGDVIDLKTASLLENHEFVADLARYRENRVTEKFIRRKYGNLDEACWTRLAESDELVAAVEEESYRRTRDGSAKRERAQQLVVAAPNILSEILQNADNSPRDRIAAKTLDEVNGVSVRRMSR